MGPEPKEKAELPAGRFVDIAICAIFTAAVIFLISMFDRGFDVTDESFYILASQDPSGIYAFGSFWQFFTAPIFKAIGQNIVLFRLCGLVILTAAGIFFGFGLVKLLESFTVLMRSRRSRITAMAFTGMGSLVYYCWYLPTPSYNLMTTAFLNASAGFFCLALARFSTPHEKMRAPVFWLFAAGLAIGICFFSKFPSGVALFLVYTCALLLWPPFSARRFWCSLAAMSAGVITLAVLYFCFFQPPMIWILAFKRSLEIGLTSRMYGFFLLKNYFVSLRDLSCATLVDFWQVYLMFFALAGSVLILKRVRKASGVLIRGAMVVFFAFAVWKCFEMELFLGGGIHNYQLSKFYASWLLVFILALAGSVFFGKSAFKTVADTDFRRKVLAAGLLGVLPIIGSFGTNADLLRHLLMNITPWFGLVFFLVSILSHRGWDFLTGRIGLSVISFFACVQIISAGIGHPYGLNAGILGQTVPTSIGTPPTTLKLDSKTSLFFGDIRQLAEKAGFGPGDNVLEFSSMPGLIYILNAESLGVPWFNLNTAWSHIANKMMLSSIAPGEFRKAFIFESASRKEDMPDFSPFGVVFPEDYTLCGELTSPSPRKTIRLWKPKEIEDRPAQN